MMDKTSGLLTIFDWENEAIIKNWQMNLPKDYKDYFPYFTDGFMNIIYGSYTKDMTYIDVESGGKCHRNMPHTRFGYSWSPNKVHDKEFSYIGLRNVRVGDFIIFFGGCYKRSDKDNDVVIPSCAADEANVMTVNSQVFLWNTKRYKWYKGPKIPIGFRDEMCGISVNGTTAVFFGMMWTHTEQVKEADGYLKKLTFQIWNKTGIQIDPYFHHLGFDEFYSKYLDFDCTTYFTKAARL